MHDLSGLWRHGHARRGHKGAEYRIWMHMRSRCNNERSPAFKHYGGRGIAVCSRWDDFCAFLEDMGPRPSNLHSLERINVDGMYEPSNCVWATMKEQQRNRRNNRVLTAFGVTDTLAAFCERLGLKYKTVHMRLAKGASPEAALSSHRAPYRSLNRG